MPGEIITDKMRGAIGVESEPLTYDIEQWHISRFAEAIGDGNPLYHDEGAARKSRLGGIVAPPTFFRALFPKEPPVNIRDEVPLKRVLDGGSDWEWFEPIRPGDKIAVTMKLADLNMKSGRTGDMLFIAMDITYTNQLGEKVATQRQNRILY